MKDYKIEIKRLSELKAGEEAIITKVFGHGAFRRRISEMGFVKGKKIKVVKNAPFDDPIEYRILNYNVSLRKSEAQLIEVAFLSGNETFDKSFYSGVIDEEIIQKKVTEKSKNINVALVGNPNSGKTTLYNQLTGSHERVGNYCGVTVEIREACLKQYGYVFTLTDLPGTYSLTDYSPEELFVRNYIFEKNPDIIINVVDASNLERNLYLTTQLIDMNVTVVIALNMYDELQRSGDKFNYQQLSEMLGIPIIPTVASQNKGIEELLKKVIEVYEEKEPLRNININYGNDIENSIHNLQELLNRNTDIVAKFSTRYLAIKLIEKDKTTYELLKNVQNFDEIKQQAEKEIKKLEKLYNETSDTIITDAKYGFIAGALNETYKKGSIDKYKMSENIDKILTNKILGFPLFILFMFLMFYFTFTLGAYPTQWIENGIGWLSNFISKILPDSLIKELLVNGIITGIGSVIVFLPNILILFFFISLMEDTGYMARTAFIMDSLMHKIGLHGKSFIPLLMGFGCNVPAVMATRTLEHRKDRILTILMIPFMSCSARLPVYILLISAFFDSHHTLILMSIYFVGIILSILTSLIAKKLFFSNVDVPFVMELPPYRLPTLRNVIMHMWHKSVQYLKKMGGLIFIASIIIWALSYFPQNEAIKEKYHIEIAQISNQSSLSEAEKQKKISEIETKYHAHQIEQSYMGRLGKFIEPVLKPLGFDWKIGISLISGFPAKEVIVSTMSILYQFDVDEENINTTSISTKIGTLNPLTAYSLMIFILLYFPCIATIIVIKNELKWKWAFLIVLYTILVAWTLAFLIYQIGSLFL